MVAAPKTSVGLFGGLFAVGWRGRTHVVEAEKLRISVSLDCTDRREVGTNFEALGDLRDFEYSPRAVGC